MTATSSSNYQLIGLQALHKLGMVHSSIRAIILLYTDFFIIYKRTLLCTANELCDSVLSAIEWRRLPPSSGITWCRLWIFKHLPPSTLQHTPWPC